LFHFLSLLFAFSHRFASFRILFVLAFTSV
jgi:hypothetical protein